MDWKNALEAAVSQGADSKLQEHLPAIQQLFREQIGTQLREHLSDPDKLVATSKSVYGMLPAPIRTFVSEDAFVQFCQEHKDGILN